MRDAVSPRSGLRKRGRRAAKRGGAPAAFIDIYKATPSQRVDWIERGIASTVALNIVATASRDKSETLAALALPVATFNRKIKAKAVFSPQESERLLGFARLIGQVEAMLEGRAGADGFDPRAWLSEWLRAPLPALDNRRPIEFLGTIEGQNLVSTTLDRIAGGVYA